MDWGIFQKVLEIVCCSVCTSKYLSNVEYNSLIISRTPIRSHMAVNRAIYSAYMLLRDIWFCIFDVHRRGKFINRMR